PSSATWGMTGHSITYRRWPTAARNGTSPGPSWRAATCGGLRGCATRRPRRPNPGRCAAWSEAEWGAADPDPGYVGLSGLTPLRCSHSASKTRVNALLALQRVREAGRQYCQIDRKPTTVALWLVSGLTAALPLGCQT